ncbi:MAG: hypothetical protein QXK74_07185 [Candidatus Nitrosocaldaceae archaeon]
MSIKDDWMEKDIREEDYLLGTDLSEEEIAKILQASNPRNTTNIYNRAKILKYSMEDYKSRRYKQVARIGEHVLKHYIELKQIADKLDLNLTAKMFHLWLVDTGRINQVSVESLDTLFTRRDHKTTLKYNPYNLKSLLLFRLRRKGKKLEGLSGRNSLDEILQRALQE